MARKARRLEREAKSLALKAPLHAIEAQRLAHVLGWLERKLPGSKRTPLRLVRKAFGLARQA